MKVFDVKQCLIYTLSQLQYVNTGIRQEKNSHAPMTNTSLVIMNISCLALLTYRNYIWTTRNAAYCLDLSSMTKRCLVTPNKPTLLAVRVLQI